MRVGIALPTLAAGDAIGNDVLGMTRALRGRGFDVDLFAWHSSVPEPVRPLSELAGLGGDDVLIYHHSIECEPGVRAVERLGRRAAVKYHNVTPPEFFAAEDRDTAERCANGQKAVPRLARSGAHIWADSEFNAKQVPGREVAVLPPFHQADALFAAAADRRAVNGLDDWGTNVLLVGRVVPNKNVPLAVRAFAEYRERHDPHARLIVAGDRPVPAHAAEVERVVRECGQEGHVLVTGKVTVEQLKALYLVADALLVTSAHEGFCVPLVEAMGLRVPVVAVPNAAVPFTAGDAAAYADGEPAAVADRLWEVVSDRAAREQRLARGFARYERQFSNAAVESQFAELFTQVANCLSTA